MKPFQNKEAITTAVAIAVVETGIKSKNGYWDLPKNPSLVMEINEKEVKILPFKQEFVHSNTKRNEDNAILVW